MAKVENRLCCDFSGGGGTALLRLKTRGKETACISSREFSCSLCKVDVPIGVAERFIAAGKNLTHKLRGVALSLKP